MIKEFKINDLDEVMKIWIETNIEAHNFVPKEYWINNFQVVKEMLPLAEVYIYKEENIIKGFIGVIDKSYIAGLFVKKEYQREGIGSSLLNYCKIKYEHIELDVFVKNKKAVNFYCKNNFRILEKKVNEETKEFEYTMVLDR